jgi:hypothetical protein
VSGIEASTFDLHCGLGTLTALTRRVAAAAPAGLHEVPIDPERRFYRRLSSDDGSMSG